MSLDSIVKISIDAQTLSLAQKGFGVPLILAVGDNEEPSIRLYRNASELPDNPLTAHKIALPSESMVQNEKFIANLSDDDHMFCAETVINDVPTVIGLAGLHVRKLPRE